MDVVALEAKGADMETKLEQSDEQLRLMQNQLGTLIQIMAIDDPDERQRRLSQAAKGWIDEGMYKAGKG